MYKRQTLDQPHGTIRGGRVEAERGNPSADLIASWLSVRLGAPFENRVSGGPGVTAVVFDTSDGELTLTRPDGRLAVLRRLDPDEVYAETIAPFVAAPAPAPAETKRNGGSSRRRVTASGDAPRKEAEAPRKDRAR